MNKSLQLTFENYEVEIITHNEIDLFNPYDVGKCLDISRSAIRKHLLSMNKNQIVKLKNSDIKNQSIRLLKKEGENFITENGLYKLIFKSNNPNADKFTDWVTDEVLPEIRSTATYTIATTEASKKMLVEEVSQTQNLKDINSMARLIINELDLADTPSICRLKVITDIYKQAKIDIRYIEELKPSKDEYYICAILKVYDRLKKEYKNDDKGLVQALETIESYTDAPERGKKIAKILIKCLLTKQKLQFNIDD